MGGRRLSGLSGGRVLLVLFLANALSGRGVHFSKCFDVWVVRLSQRGEIFQGFSHVVFAAVTGLFWHFIVFDRLIKQLNIWFLLLLVSLCLLLIRVLPDTR